MAVNPDSSASRPTIGDHVPLRGGAAPRPYPFSGGRLLNDSSYRFLRSTLRGLSRSRLLRLRSKLWCPECLAVRRVVDFFSGPDVVLMDCRHRRPVFNRTLDEQAAFEQADRERQTRRQIAGKNCVNANGYCVTFVENVEEIAA